MILNLSGSNYKAFESFNMDIKPLTILLGANSCGKSSLINALLMISQSYESKDIAESPLRLNGNRIGLGENINIFKDKNKDNILSFSFEFSDKKRMEKLLVSQKHEIAYYYFFLHNILKRFLHDAKKYLPNEEENSTLNDAFFRADLFKSKNLNLISSNLNKFIKIYRENRAVFKDKKWLSEIKSHNIEKIKYSHITYLLNDLIQKKNSTVIPKRIMYSFYYNEKDEVARIQSFEIFNSKNELILRVSNIKGGVVESEVFKKNILNNNKKLILEHIDFNSITMVKDREDKRINYFDNEPKTIVSYFIGLIEIATYNATRDFSLNSINHISPLRAFPQRYYLLDKSIYHEKLDTLNGIQLAEILKKNSSIINKINLLFSEFYISIKIARVNDIIHKIIVTQDGVELELTDVGFGISQVLPILVQAYLSPKDSITIIEQPEIHLHPKMQAWLTDALIKIALEENKNFIIETHSETLIRRIRLRIVDNNSSLQKDHIAIYYIERDDENIHSNLNKIDIKDNGDINWPKNFMDVEINDILAIQQFNIMNKRGIH
jgi:predicted ATPase